MPGNAGRNSEAGLGGRASDGAGGGPADGNGCEAPAAEGCFEPCGGDPSGAWLLEDTCFDGGESADYCAGAFVDGTPRSSSMRLRIIEGRTLELKGSDNWDFRATVPRECLGIESTTPCALTDFYLEPLLTSFVTGLLCKENACGSCECAGALSGEPLAYGPLELGTTTMRFGSREVPYCVEGETLWLGGRGPDGAPKAAYKFLKRSCVGPPCSELPRDECELSLCTWGSDGCEGYSPCHHDYCDAEAGCTWGPPNPHCGYELGEYIAICRELSLEECHDVPGCIIDW